MQCPEHLLSSWKAGILNVPGRGRLHDQPQYKPWALSLWWASRWTALHTYVATGWMVLPAHWERTLGFLPPFWWRECSSAWLGIINLTSALAVGFAGLASFLLPWTTLHCMMQTRHFAHLHVQEVDLLGLSYVYLSFFFRHFILSSSLRWYSKAQRKQRLLSEKFVSQVDPPATNPPLFLDAWVTFRDAL